MFKCRALLRFFAKREEKIHTSPPPRSFTCTIFRAIFDSRSLFFAPTHLKLKCNVTKENM